MRGKEGDGKVLKGEGGEVLKGMAEPEYQKRKDCRDWYLLSLG